MEGSIELTSDNSFDDLVEQYLGKRLPEPLAAAISMPDLPPDTQDFILRMLSLMKRAGYPADNFTPALLRWLSATIPSTLPRAWGGRIPPVTFPGRHKKLDDYVANYSWNCSSGTPIYVDVGCGFPPVTSADTAKRFSGWHIYGVDKSFAEYVLYDSEGHYACFGKDGNFLYFQALMNLSGRALYANPEATRHRFNKLFEELSPLLKHLDDSESEAVKKNGNKLIHHHIRNFETNNLTFIKSDVADITLPPAKVIRCMNLLIYYRPENRSEKLKQIGNLLRDDGILIVGTNGLGLQQSRYSVYQKGLDGMFPYEFAFSLDNLGHIVFMPWFTIHENDPESLLLADLTSTIRSDRKFWIDFSNRIDKMLQQYEICERKSNGYLHFPREDIPPNEYIKKSAEIWRQIEAEGYHNSAVEVLKQAGYNAWMNSVGDIAVQPPAGVLPMNHPT